MLVAEHAAAADGQAVGRNAWWRAWRQSDHVRAKDGAIKCDDNGGCLPKQQRQQRRRMRISLTRHDASLDQAAEADHSQTATLRVAPPAMIVRLAIVING